MSYPIWEGSWLCFSGLPQIPPFKSNGFEIACYFSAIYSRAYYADSTMYWGFYDLMCVFLCARKPIIVKHRQCYSAVIVHQNQAVLHNQCIKTTPTLLKLMFLLNVGFLFVCVCLSVTSSYLTSPLKAALPCWCQKSPPWPRSRSTGRPRCRRSSWPPLSCSRPCWCTEPAAPPPPRWWCPFINREWVIQSQAKGDWERLH